MHKKVIKIKFGLSGISDWAVRRCNHLLYRIYTMVIEHINFHGQNVYFVGFGVITFKDKPYWNPLFGFLKNKSTNSSLEHNSTFAI